MMLRDPVHGLVAFEGEAARIVPELLATREVQRLRHIHQLGLTHYAYPGADHTRFAHALGAAHVMTRFIRRLREIHDVLPAWQRITVERERAAVAAALLHDIGHGPFSHLFEDALPDTPSHEVWTARIVLDPTSQVNRVLRSHDSTLPEQVVQLMNGQYELTFLAKLISGAFDVDRCDYLLRDAHATGVGYGAFDLDWLLYSLRFGLVEATDTAPALAVDGPKGLPAIESFTLARLFMFQQVYFHKTSRSSEWMLGRILARLRELLLDGTHVEEVPRALRSLILNGDAELAEYLDLDDPRLWLSLRAWHKHADPILADFCGRLCERRLFKTYELFGSDVGPEPRSQLLELARELGRQRGFAANAYVGLDVASDVPYDERYNSLRVIFPSGPPRSPAEVSFLLGRLNQQPLERVRLIFPGEVRTALQQHLETPHPEAGRLRTE